MSPNQDVSQPRWAWLALAALCYVAIMFGGCVKSIGILYVEFLEIYQHGSVVTSLLQTIFLVSLTLGTMTGGALSDRVSLRVILFIAAVICTGGYIIAAFAPNFIVILLGCGFLSGFGIGLITSTPASTIVSMFKKKRHLAIGIYWSFSSIGSTVMPLLYGLLITYIKVKGMLLVISGMWFLLIIVGFIVQPRKIKEVQNIINNKNPGSQAASKKSNTRNVEYGIGNENIVSVAGQLENSEHENTNLNNNRENLGKTNDGFVGDCEGSRTRDAPDNKSNEQININNISSTHTTETSSQHTVISKDSKRKQICQVLSNGRFWLILFIISFSQMGNFSALYLLPSFAKEKGQHLTGITLVVSTFGICDLIGRVCFGYLGDKKTFSRFTILTCCQLVAGGGVLVLTFIEGNYVPYLMSVILGLCGGIHVVYTAPLVADIVPTKITGTASGIAFMSMFLCTAAIQTPAGLLQAASGTYASGIQMACGFYLVAVLFTAPLGLKFLFHRCTSKGYTL